DLGLFLGEPPRLRHLLLVSGRAPLVCLGSWLGTGENGRASERSGLSPLRRATRDELLHRDVRSRGGCFRSDSVPSCRVSAPFGPLRFLSRFGPRLRALLLRNHVFL